MTRPTARICYMALAATFAFAPGAACSQGISGVTGGGRTLEIEADDGIAWRRQEQVYVARGNAKATRGDLSVEAATLRAHYRRPATGDGTEIYRIEAETNVKLSTPGETAYGARGIYDLDKGVMVLRGDNLRLATGAETITARDSLEYWTERNLAVARGKAVARRKMDGGERRMAAAILAAHLRGGDADVERIEAFENVRIASPTTMARGDKGVYVAADGVATLVGDVKISRGENQLNGGYAEVNLNTGVSRLLGAPPDSDAKARVRGLLRPRKDGLDASRQ